MKYRGDIKVIENIEQLITKGTYYAIEKGKDIPVSSNGNSEPSRLFTRKYKIQIGSTIVIVRLGFDYRDDMGSIHIRDDKAWKLASVLSGFSLQMGKLKPFYTNKWPRGQMMQAIDKLLD